MKTSIVLALALGGCCGPAAADTLWTYTRESPEIVMPSGHTRGCDYRPPHDATKADFYEEYLSIYHEL